MHSIKQLFRFLLLAVAVLALPVPGWAAGEQRLALVIGNASYKHSPLANPVNDARLMELALKEAGFTVIKSENASIREMRRLVREFGDRLKSSGGVGLFYFAGHGVQVRGENFLVSTDSDIRNEEEVPDDSVNANVVLDRMQSAGNRMNIIILDACRDNPFANKSRSASNGLATLNAPSGSLVAYATAPGSVASDGRGGNGLYTRHLANAIRQSGLPIEEVFKQVRAAVRRDSNNQQTPWENTALEGQFFFRESVALTAPVVPPAITATPPIVRPTSFEASVVELAFWDSIKASQRISELEAYLSQYPGGAFASLARARISEIKPATIASVDATPKPVVKVEPPLVASVQRPVQTAPSVPISGGVIGTLTLTDGLTKAIRRQDVTLLTSDGGRSLYSTGDMVTQDGQVMQVFMGDWVARVVSGALWTIPVKAGVAGEARIADIQVSSSGSLAWKAVAIGDGKVQVDVTFFGLPTRVGTSGSSMKGLWQAVYADSLPNPVSFSLRARDQHGIQAATSAEFKPR